MWKCWVPTMTGLHFASSKFWKHPATFPHFSKVLIRDYLNKPTKNVLEERSGFSLVLTLNLWWCPSIPAIHQNHLFVCIIHHQNMIGSTHQHWLVDKFIVVVVAVGSLASHPPVFLPSLLSGSRRMGYSQPTRDPCGVLITLPKYLKMPQLGQISYSKTQKPNFISSS